MPKALFGESGPFPRHPRRIRAEKDTGAGGSRRCISDPHLSRPEKPVPIFAQLFGKIDPCQDCCLSLLSGHCILTEYVACTVRDSAIQNSVRFRKVLHSHIHGNYIRPGLCCHSADSSLPLCHAPGNNACHRAVGLGNSLCGHSIVRAEDHNRFFIQGNIRTQGKAGNLRDLILQKAKPAQRVLYLIPSHLCEMIDLLIVGSAASFCCHPDALC